MKLFLNALAWVPEYNLFNYIVTKQMATNHGVGDLDIEFLVIHNQLSLRVLEIHHVKRLSALVQRGMLASQEISEIMSLCTCLFAIKKIWNVLCQIPYSTLSKILCLISLQLIIRAQWYIGFCKVRENNVPCFPLLKP